MSKIPRKAAAFAQRVRMGRQRLWLIVEGRVCDRSFYDRLLRTVPELGGEFEIRLAEQIELNGKTAGGKTHALNLFHFFASKGSLTQPAHQGTRSIVFALDADYDRFTGKAIGHNHVIYTIGMDSEADLLVNADLAQAASDAHAIPVSQLRPFVDGGMRVALELASRWREWNLFGLQSAACGIGTAVLSSKASAFNHSTYGLPDGAKVDAARVPFERAARAAGKDSELRLAEGKLDSLYRSGESWKLIKGKWMAKYVVHLVDTNAEEPWHRVSSEVVTKTSVNVVDFYGAWADYYRARITALLALPY